MMKKLVLLLLLSHLGFSQWETFEIPTTASFRALKSYKNAIWAGGTEGTVGYSQDGGKHWNFQQVPGAENLDFRDLIILSQKHVLLMSAGPSAEGKAKIFETKDGGKTWKICFEKKEIGFFFDCFLLDEATKTAYLLADPIDGKFVLFTYSNETFTQVDPTKCPTILPGEAAFAASGSSLLIQNKTIYIATGGASKARILKTKLPIVDGWETCFETNNLEKSSGYFALGSNEKDEIWIAGGDYTKPKSNLIPAMSSQDDGKTWLAIPKIPAIYIEKIYHTKPYWVISGTAGSAVYNPKRNTWRNLGEGSYHNIVEADGRLWGIGAKGQIAKIDLSTLKLLFLTEE